MCLLPTILDLRLGILPATNFHALAVHAPFTLFYYICLGKRRFFETPKTLILYEPVFHYKLLLLVMTSCFSASTWLFVTTTIILALSHQSGVCCILTWPCIIKVSCLTLDIDTKSIVVIKKILNQSFIPKAS